MLRVGIAVLHVTMGLISTSVFGAELPFDKADEFPAGAYDFIADKRIVWLGEVHGTNEAPELLLGLVKLVTKHHGEAPVVALEIPASHQTAIDGYMASGDESFLRTCAFFTSANKDGRQSQALVRLLSNLRSEAIAAVVCFDAVSAMTSQDRSTMMAENLHAAAEKFSSAKLVVLSGNRHSRVVEGTPWDPTYRSVAFELGRKIPALVSFTMECEGGTAFFMTQDGFGEQKMRGGIQWEGTAPHYVAIYPEPVRGHHGVVFTRTVTGSPPW